MSTCRAGQNSIFRRTSLSNWFALEMCGKDKVQLSKRRACKQVKSKLCIIIKHRDGFSWLLFGICRKQCVSSNVKRKNVQVRAALDAVL